MKFLINEPAKGFDTYVIPCTEGATKMEIGSDAICPTVAQTIDVALSSKKVTASPACYSVVADGKIVNVILFAVNQDTLRGEFLQIGKVFKECQKLNSENVAFMCNNVPAAFNTFPELEKTFELPNLVNYKFEQFLSKKSSSSMSEVTFFLNSKQGENATGAMEEAVVVSTSTCITRDAVNYPTSYMSPQIFSQLAIDKGAEFGFETEILDKKALEELGANSMLAVGAGSKNPPALVVMRYKGADPSAKTYAVVGKGIMFDSGGYSLKAKMGMITQHTDMGGGAAVLGAMCAVVQMKLKINLVAIVPACENLIGENAYLPGTIIGSLLGRTTEVISTDGEGRLVLCDGLTYAWQKEKADVLIDIATLTGACVAAVGSYSSAGITTCDNIWDNVKAASDNCCEKIWRLDLDEELRENLKSFRADSKNTPTGGKPGGSILGALFLRPFTNNLPWLHIDMAPVAWKTSDTPTGPKGATGFGVSLLYNLFKNLEEK